MASFIERILRTGEKRSLKRLRQYADAVNLVEEDFKALTDAELRAETDSFKTQIADGVKLDALLPEAFGAVREAAARTVGLRHFDVQLMGGAALHEGMIAEMKTGEGKTLVATAPAYLNALSGESVHIVTVNDYLAEYQSELMGRIFRFLGMNTGVISSGLPPSQRKAQYDADITYGTNNEFGFDYLRDNMVMSKDDMVQRGHGFAIVDEIDSILIDEARTPLIISGPAQGDVSGWYSQFASLAPRLKIDIDYEIDEKKRTVSVLEHGIDKVEDWLGIENLYESANTPLIGHLNNAIRAKELFLRGREYEIIDGEVRIIDEHTGRMLPGRRLSDGLHQAIEAKEKVKVNAENQTLASVTLQNYFRKYNKLSGMTGTAETEAAEFMSTYELGVVPIPTHREVQRHDQQDLVYKHEKAKFAAVVEDVVERHKAGQPVLIGTTSVEKSEYVSKLLAKEGVKHEVLNAKNYAREAAIIAEAGRLGSVTVATNMAGRGTDIILGGNAEFAAVAEMNRRGLDPEEHAEEYENVWTEVFAQAQEDTKQEREAVKESGGLYVLGTERHESRRIDNQLRGRSGRQGDPGESRFYLSMTDDLLRLFNAGMAQRVMGMSNYPDDMPLEAKMVSKAIERAQGTVEERNTQQRKDVLKYDQVMNSQREAIYADRRQILEGEDLQTQIEEFIEGSISDIVDDAFQVGNDEEVDGDQLWHNLKGLYPVSLTQEDIEQELGSLSSVKPADLKRELISDAKVLYGLREEELGEDLLRNVERRVLLESLGQKWQEHLYEMDYLREGVGLRAMAQRDPLVEYQREGHTMFQSMMQAVREDTVYKMFHAKVRKPELKVGSNMPGVAADFSQIANFGNQKQQPLQYSGPSASSPGATTTQTRAADGQKVTQPQKSRAERKADDREARKAAKKARKNS
ncbi:preprotein translocase subunit SecA [Yaniella flava]|uniref:Protein translocase subunit SecA n=1 Tax=Yaniella flava TaxID=287930 RepID=A0ABN2U6H8_9MICC